jgi:hypothetical protein
VQRLATQTSAAATLAPLAQTPPAQLNTFQLIDRAWLDAEIDLDHSAVYKIWGLFGARTEFPSQFLSSVPVYGDGTMLFLYAVQNWELLSPATPNATIPPGRYTETIHTGEHAQTDLPIDGQWEMNLQPRGFNQLSLNRRLVLSQSYVLGQGQITFVDEFGSYACAASGRIVHLPTRKFESLFAYLAFFPECHAREKIAVLFWGDSTDDQARASLRNALTVIRKALGADLLIADRENVQINLAARLVVDVREFQKSLQAHLNITNFKTTEFTQTQIDELESALAVYQGDLLNDLGQVASWRGDWARALDLFNESLDLWQGLISMKAWYWCKAMSGGSRSGKVSSNVR